MADSKKGHFSKSPILNIFFGLVALNDAKGIDTGNSTYMVMRLSDISSKTGKKRIFGVFRLFLSFDCYHELETSQFHILEQSRPKANEEKKLHEIQIPP